MRHAFRKRFRRASSITFLTITAVGLYVLSIGPVLYFSGVKPYPKPTPFSGLISSIYYPLFHCPYESINSALDSYIFLWISD